MLMIRGLSAEDTLGREGSLLALTILRSAAEWARLQLSAPRKSVRSCVDPARLRTKAFRAVSCQQGNRTWSRSSAKSQDHR